MPAGPTQQDGLGPNSTPGDQQAPPPHSPSITPRPPAAAADMIGDTVGEYRLLDKLGEGGFGSVWLAERHGAIVQRVALKLIKPGMDTHGVVARFEQERQALALMDHPAIARVFDAGATPQGRPYFAMEHVPGLPLCAHAAARNLSVRERLDLFAQACEGVHHAHTHGILHRDLKPSNILVRDHDGRDHAKVIDFGIAKALSGPLTDKTVVTREGSTLGTPLYMSPEQLEGRVAQLSPASDVYSLGVTLFELVTGRLPWLVPEGREGDNAFLAKLIAATEPTRLSGALPAHGPCARPALGDALRGDLQTIILRAMDAEPRRRYGSARDLADDVRRAAAGEPIHARRDSAVYVVRRRVARALERNRPVAFLTAWGLAVIVSLLLIPVLFRWLPVDSLGERVLAATGAHAGALESLDHVRILDIGAGAQGAALAALAGVDGVTDADRFSRRRIHAKMIRRLGAVSPACIVSDVLFSTDQPDHDHSLVDAMGAMEEAAPPLPVVLGVKRWWLNDAEELQSAMRSVAWARFGGITVSGRDNTWCVDAAASRDGVRWQPHVALVGFAAARHPGCEVDVEVNTEKQTLTLEFWKPGGGMRRAAGDPVTIPIVDVTTDVASVSGSPDAWRSADGSIVGTPRAALYQLQPPTAAVFDACTWTYERAFNAGDQELAAWAAGKVIVLGDSENDFPFVVSGIPTPGMRLIACGIEQLIRRHGLRTPNLVAGLFILATASLAGVSIVALTAGWRSWAGLVGAAAVAIGVCILVYADGVVVLNPVGPVSALLTGAGMGWAVMRPSGRAASG